MTNHRRWGGITGIFLAAALLTSAADSLYQQTATDLAVSRYGVTGKGVVIAILDRGIQFQHPDFRNSDGTTRIKYLLDMSGQNYCTTNNPDPIEYTEAQINAALMGGSTQVPERDAVGHGTVTAGLAAGNGSAFADGEYKGIAPNADIIIVKLTSDGVPSYSINGTAYPAEASFTACHTQALDWLNTKVGLLGEPMAALINSGVQLWGPIDGTSIVSRTLDESFQDVPGRIYVEASGDEGGLPTHAGGSYTSSSATTVHFNKSAATAGQMAIWYTGNEPADVTLSLSDGTVVGPIGPGSYGTSSDDSVSIVQFVPGQEFYPATSTSGDIFVNLSINGHPGTGTITIQGHAANSGKFDIYSDVGSVDTFLDHLVGGHITDWASTKSAITTGAYILQNAYMDINGNPQNTGETIGALWAQSSEGPTRDGRQGG